LDPRFLVALINLAELDLLEGRKEQARARMDAAVSAEPGNHIAVAGLAMLRVRAGAPPNEVQASLVESIKQSPTEVAPRLKLVEFLLSQRQQKAALAAAQEAAATFPDHVQVLDALGRVLLVSGNPEQALSAFKRITNIDPNLAVAHLRLAEVHQAMGNVSPQVGSLRRAIEIDPKLSAARSALVELLVGAKRAKEAIEIAQDLQKREPTSPSGYLLEGAVHRKLKKHEASVAVYRTGLQKASDPGELPLNLLVSLLAADKWKAAEDFALGWLQKRPTDGAVIYNLAEGYLKYRDYGNAEKYFALAVSLRPDYVQALNNLAWVLVQQGKSGAVDYARRASLLAPNQPAVLDTLAIALAADKQWDEAVQTQKKAVELAPGNADFRFNLANIALKSGDKALAKAELERVLALGGRAPIRDEASKLLKTL
jgi:cellulose synthase operon protein C